MFTALLDLERDPLDNPRDPFLSITVYIYLYKLNLILAPSEFSCYIIIQIIFAGQRILYEFVLRRGYGKIFSSTYIGNGLGE